MRRPRTVFNLAPKVAADLGDADAAFLCPFHVTHFFDTGPVGTAPRRSAQVTGTVHVPDLGVATAEPERPLRAPSPTEGRDIRTSRAPISVSAEKSGTSVVSEAPEHSITARRTCSTSES